MEVFYYGYPEADSPDLPDDLLRCTDGRDHSQNGAEDGLGAIAGGSDTYLGKGKAGTLDAKLSRLTKWIAAVFVLLTLFVALLGSL